MHPIALLSVGFVATHPGIIWLITGSKFGKCEIQKPKAKIQNPKAESQKPKDESWKFDGDTP